MVVRVAIIVGGKDSTGGCLPTWLLGGGEPIKFKEYNTLIIELQNV